jgi:hypothetical protein
MSESLLHTTLPTARKQITCVAHLRALPDR